MAVECEADGVAGAGAFGERGVEHARTAEIGEQAFGDFEGAAVGADVLAENERLRALAENFTQAEIERLGGVEMLRCGGRGLPRQRGARGGEHIRQHRGRIGGGTREGEGNVDGRFDESVELGVEGVEVGGAVRGDELRAELGERIAGEKPFGFAGFQVIARVVGGVAAQAQRVGLDEERARGGADFFDGRGKRAGGGGDVEGGVEREALDAVAGGALPELGVARELLGDGRGVRVAVVFDDEENRQREERGEVQRFVDIAGAGAAVAEESKAHGGAAEAALGIGRADDVAEHGAEVADHRQRPRGGVAVVDVALAREGGAAGVGEILVEMIAEVTAPDEVAAVTAM